MKTLPKLLITLAVAAAFSFAYPAKANLITNPGFETGDFTGWSVTGAATVTGTFNGIMPHTGSFQAVLGSHNAASGEIDQSIATIAGQSYTINFWLALPPPGANPNLFTFAWGGALVL